MAELTMLLAFATASIVLLLFMGLAQPIWCIIDCAIDDRRSTTSKVVWIIFLVLLWGVTNWFYGAFAASGSVLRRTTGLAWLAAILLLIGFSMLPTSIRSDLRQAIEEARDVNSPAAPARSVAPSGEVAEGSSGNRPAATVTAPPLALPDLRIERIVPAATVAGLSGRWFNVTVLNKGVAATTAPVDFHARALIGGSAGNRGRPLLVQTCAAADLDAPGASEPACPRASLGTLAPGARKTVSMYIQGMATEAGSEKFRVELAINPCKGAFAFGIDDLPDCEVAEVDATNNTATLDGALFKSARRDNIK